MRASLAFGLLVVTLALPGRSADAQAGDPVAEARVHFDRGLELFNEGRHDAALAEFTRAYQIAPAPPVLYNIARVHEALGNAVEATDSYETYLRQAGENLDAYRRREVEAALARQRARIAYLTVATNVEGATVSVDGVDVATTPLDAPLRLSAGEHTVGARGAGHESRRRSVSLAGGDRITLELELAPTVSGQGTLRIESDVPDVEVRLDDRVLGTTPLNATIPTNAGTHIIVARRPGYREQQITVELEGGAERVVGLEMQPDADAPADVVGRLRIRLPDAPAIVRVNGEPIVPRTAGIVLPSGRHRVEFEVAEREPHSVEVEVPAGSALELTPELIWTPDARAYRVSAAATTRTWGQVITIGGAAALLGSVGILGWNEGRISHTDARVEEVRAAYGDMNCDGGLFTMRCQELFDEGEALTEEQNDEQRARWISLSAVGLGAILTAIGIILWVSTPGESSIDEAAHASRAGSMRLVANPGGLTLDGTF